VNWFLEEGREDGRRERVLDIQVRRYEGRNERDSKKKIS
jgi:hypothetical protein